MLKLGRWFGVDVGLDWTVAILGYLSFSSYYNYVGYKIPDIDPIELVLTSLLVTVGVVFSILAHEFGHVLVGQRHGVEFSSVILYAFGGAASMVNRMPSPKSEFFTAIAGPATSIALSFAFLVMATFSAILELTLFVIPFTILFAININLGVFNLLPAFPLDGGRVLRAAIWKYKESYYEATKVSSYTGKAFGCGLIAAGLCMSLGFNVPYFGTGIGSGIWLALIGFLVIGMAKKELEHASRGNG